ncbi:MAG: hypothetical protein LBT90_03500 [Holosporaceae bacterium]|jgi:hypothetical protein|nr:hypothetical protein [Holosporaceae bacterium]
MTCFESAFVDAMASLMFERKCDIIDALSKRFMYNFLIPNALSTQIPAPKKACYPSLSLNRQLLLRPVFVIKHNLNNAKNSTYLLGVLYIYT